MNQPESAASSTVLLLGAGFSRAVSVNMPLTDELGAAVVRRLALKSDPRFPAEFGSGSFETWLSHLADEQPFLTAPQNLENHALFLRLSEAIAEELGEHVQTVLADPWPGWLPELVRTAHWQRSTVLTFNYDTLIECAAATGLLYEWPAPEPVSWTETTEDLPNWPPGSARLGAAPADTFRLLKLHGSLNWYWTPGDEAGTSVARRDLPGRFGEPTPYSEEGRRRELPGRVPFVVPPSASKSTFYRNPLLREFWRQARNALQDAGHVVLIGYSMPLTDLTVVDMLRDALGRSKASVTVVNPQGIGVADRLAELGVPRERITLVGGTDEEPVASFVRNWVLEVGIRTASGLSGVTGEDLDDPLLVVWGPECASAVVEVIPDDVAPRLIIEQPELPWPAIRTSGARLQHPLPKLREVLQKLQPGSVLRVQLPDGSLQTVIELGAAVFNLGYGRGHWHVLYTSGPSPQMAVA